MSRAGWVRYGGCEADSWFPASRKMGFPCSGAGLERRRTREAAKLESCYLRCLELAREHEATTLAFPAISTGVYHFPKGPAAQIAVRVCRELADSCGVERVEFVCFDEATATWYERVLGDA